MEQIIYIQYENKKYPVIISDCTNKQDIKDGFVHVKCEIANINQEVLKEDVLGFLDAMPDFIRVWNEVKQEIDKKENLFQIRLSRKDKLKIEDLAKKSGYKNVSSYARDRLLQIV